MLDNDKEVVMGISIFGINDSSWLKKICWRGVFFVSTCTCIVLLFAPDRILRFIDWNGLSQGTRRLIGVLFLVSVFGFVLCITPIVLAWLREMKNSFQWTGRRARDKIKALSQLAQEQVRENIERDTPLKLFKEGDVYVELTSGNFVETLTVENNLMAVCRLREWVVECIKQYPDLVGELHEMDARERDFV